MKNVSRVRKNRIVVYFFFAVNACNFFFAVSRVNYKKKVNFFIFAVSRVIFFCGKSCKL